MHLFGYDTNIDSMSSRHFVWKIERFVLITLLIGGVLSFILNLIWWISDSLFFNFITTMLYFVAFALYALALNGKATSAIAKINQMVAQGSMLPSNVPEFEGDILEDKDFAVLTGKINFSVALVPIIFLAVLLWIFSVIGLSQLKVITFYLWFIAYWGLAFWLSILAERAAQDDFSLSLRGALIKLFNVDTTSFQG